jgi:hypothetical protein
MTYEELKAQIEEIARFESLVHLPDKPRDPDWPHWVARATVEGHGTNGEGETEIEALENLLKNLQDKASA